MKRKIFLVIFGLTFISLFIGRQKNQKVNAQTDKRIYVFDATKYPTNYWKTVGDYDILTFLSTLQGVVNKDGPLFYIIGHQDWDYYPTYHYTFNSSFNQNVDRYWLDKMKETGQWLNGYQEVQLNSLDEVLNAFNSYLAKGVVVWDQSVPATINVATTIAGVESRPIVKYDTTSDSLYTKLITQRGLPAISLVDKFTGTGIIPDTNLPSSGSKKNDAYLWALEKYLKTGKTNTKLLGYFEDSFAEFIEASGRKLNLAKYPSARDYLVKNKAFVFDLSPFGDEKACDDPGQSLGLDLDTFKKILQENYDRNGHDQMIEVYGFFPWWNKYCEFPPNCKGQHRVTKGETDLVDLISQYNGYLNGHSDMWAGNISFHSWAPKPERLIQNPKPLPKDLENKTYITFMVADFDPIDALYFLTPLWESRTNPSGRGSIPLSYNIDPNFIEQVPDLINYWYQTKSPMDFFASNTYGAGYLHPNRLSQEGLTAWRDFNIKYFRWLSYSVNAYGTDYSRPIQGVYDVYRNFAGDGMRMVIVKDDLLAPPDQQPTDHLEGKMPFLYSTNTGWGAFGGVYRDNLTEAVSNIASGIISDLENPNNTNHFGNLGERPNFYGAKIVWPDSYELFDKVFEKLQQLKPEYHFEAVDIYTFFYLFRQSLGGNNNYRATFVNDTLPTVLETGKTYNFEITVRNDGWDTWTNSDTNLYALGQWFYRKGTIPFKQIPAGACSDPFLSCHFPPVPHPVNPGETVTFNLNLTAPNQIGDYVLHYDMFQSNITWFQDQDNLFFEKEVKVSEFNGDLNNDGQVNTQDIVILLQNWGSSPANPRADLNGDGVVNGIDFEKLRKLIP